MEINEEKRKKFMEYAGKRVNNVLHDIQILEPMSRSATYDFTKQDVEEMFAAMQESLDTAKAEFYKKFEEKARNEKRTFTFGSSASTDTTTKSTLEAVPTVEPIETHETEIANVDASACETVETL